MQPGDGQLTTWRPRLFGQGERENRGVPKAVPLAQPLAGADWTYSHFGPSWLLIRSIVAQLLTSATVAARAARVRLTYQSQLVLQLPPTGTQAASLTNIYCANTAYSSSGDPLTQIWPLPETLILKDGMVLASNTVNIQAGDQWSNIALLVEEFTDRCLDDI
jgi:hypothetical protein